MSIILVIVFVLCMFLWLLAALPLAQTTPFNWAHPILAWIAVAILGYVVLSGAQVRLSALGISFFG
jgi:hypothetical protein